MSDIEQKLAEVTAELARLTTWHQASEIPPDWTEAEVRCLSGRRYVAHFDPNRWWHAPSGETVTHWRELPPGPEVKL